MHFNWNIFGILYSSHLFSQCPVMMVIGHVLWWTGIRSWVTFVTDVTKGSSGKEGFRDRGFRAHPILEAGMRGNQSHYTHLSKNISHRLASRQIWWRHCLNWDSLFLGWRGLCRCHGRQGHNLQRGENENSVEPDLLNLDQTSESLMPGGLLSIYLNTM